MTLGKEFDHCLLRCRLFVSRGRFHKLSKEEGTKNDIKLTASESLILMQLYVD